LPVSPTTGRRPRLSSSLGRLPVVFQSPSAVAPSAPLLLLSVVVPVSPTAGRHPHLSSSPGRPPVVFQSPSAAAPSAPLLLLPVVVHLGAAASHWPSSRIQLSPLYQLPSVTRLWSKLMLRSKLLLPVQAVAAAGASCCCRFQLLPIQAAHHMLEHRSIDSCAACAKSFVRT
jgi:hypothetical protein